MIINSEKSAKKIIQAFPYYYDKLIDGNVFMNFKELLGKMKKVQKPSDEYKKMLVEYEDALVKYSCQNNAVSSTDDVIIMPKFPSVISEELYF